MGVAQGEVIAVLVAFDVRVDFLHEMRRFLPPDVVTRTVENPAFWVYLRNTLEEECQRVLRFLTQGGTTNPFRM